MTCDIGTQTVRSSMASIIAWVSMVMPSRDGTSSTTAPRRSSAFQT
jgi:hypothetical protein